MEQARLIVLFISLAAAAVLLFRRSMVEAVIEAIENFRGGGPPTPMHPSPADDAALLHRRARKVED